jgi:uncharacterized protein with ParB-like and HNH nuclease domain
MIPDNTQNTVDLINAIDTLSARVHTQSLDLSFNELLDMYKNNELNITPDYQRLFQWSEGASSRFIESLLLEMPVPPIYVVEEEDGKYLLIDGLQRISSYLYLRGELEALHLQSPIYRGEKLKFVDCDIVTELNGETYDSLATALQIRLKRAFVRVEVVRKGSDSRFKYHMFKRLNNGGVILSPQQIRNCTIRLLDAKFNDFLGSLSEVEVFKSCVENISEEQKLAFFDQELILRFFAFKNYRDKYVHDIADYLTEYMEAVSEPDGDNKIPFDYEAEEKIFIKTFTIFDKTLRELSFGFANKTRDKITGGFSVLHFEAFTMGIQPFLEKVDVNDENSLNKLRMIFEQIKFDPVFHQMTTGGGKNTRGLLQRRIEFVENKLQETL